MTRIARSSKPPGLIESQQSACQSAHAPLGAGFLRTRARYSAELSPMRCTSKLAQNERRTANKAVVEATDGPPQPDSDRPVVDLHDRRCLVRQVARADVIAEHDVVPDAELGQCRGCGDGSKQLPPRLDRVRDRHQVRIKLAAGDGIKELSLRLLGPTVIIHVPEERLRSTVSTDRHADIVAAAPDRREKYGRADCRRSIP